MATIEEIEKRRAERREGHDKARAAQELVDLEAIDALEMATGEPLHTMTANGFKLGVPVKVAFGAPSAVQYKRYCDMVGKAMQKNAQSERQKAQELFALSCWVYPAAETEERKAMLEAFPGVLISMAIEVAKIAELRAEDEAKS